MVSQTSRSSDPTLRRSLRTRPDAELAVSEASDAELMCRLCDGDLRALESLYDRHHQMAMGLALRIVRDRSMAEDIVQDAYLTLWRQPDRFDPRRGSVRGWLLTIVHHKSVDRLRRQSRAHRVVELTAECIDDTADPGDLAVQSVERDQLRAALDRLPAFQRRAIELAFLHGRTHAEIAELMHCPLGTVKGRIRIGLEKLRAGIAAAEPVAA
jgi:RNA polymerase sigma-70 factor (ECF subfamily)